MGLYKVTYNNGVTQGLSLFVACDSIESAVKCYRENVENRKAKDSVKLVSVEYAGNCIVY
jgi:hypothetical protein